MENASVISLALLLNQSGQIDFHRPFMFPAYPHLCHQCTDRGLFPASAPLVLLRLPGKWGWGTEGAGQWCVFAPVGLLGLWAQQMRGSVLAQQGAVWPEVQRTVFWSPNTHLPICFVIRLIARWASHCEEMIPGEKRGVNERSSFTEELNETSTPLMGFILKIGNVFSWKIITGNISQSATVVENDLSCLDILVCFHEVHCKVKMSADM